MKRVLGLLLAGMLISAGAGAENLIISRAVLEDPAGLLSISEVVEREFTTVEAIPSRGYTDAVRWIRLEIAAPQKGSEVVLAIAPPYLDEIRLFEADHNLPSHWKIRVTGDRYPYEERDRVSPGLGFVVHIEQPAATVYLRLRTTSSSRVYLDATDPHDAQRKEFRSLVIEVLFVTVMLLMLLWGLQHNLADRQAVLGWFCLYQTTYVIYVLAITGFVALFMPAAHAEWADRITSILVCALTFTFALFTRSLFRAYSPPALVVRGFDLLLLAFPLEMLAMAGGHARAALHANAIVIAASLVFYVVAGFGLRQEQVPGRRVLLAVYAAIALFGLLPQVSNISLLTTADSWLTFALPMYAHGLITGLLLVMLLSARLSAIHRLAHQAELDLAMTQRTLEIEHSLKEQAEEQARTDYLTGLLNRRHFVELAERELDRAERYQRPLTLLMVDIDHFKLVNDTRGHATGDLVLQEVARLIRAAVRSVDIVGRIGGEEFAAVLPEIDEASALDVAQRLRELVEEASIAVPEGVPVKVTISIGIAHLRGRNANLDTLLSEADAAMYSAKESGRNSVVVSG